MVGSKLHINIRSNGTGGIEKSHHITRRIVAEYIGGRVRDHVGDTWTVRPTGNGDFKVVR